MRVWIQKCCILIVLVGIGILPAGANAQNLNSESYQILAPVITPGGYGTSTNFTLFGIIGEFVHDIASSASYSFNPGFAAYPFVSSPVVTATAGDASVSLTWTAAVGVLGYSVSGYDIGRSTSSGGPYTYTDVGSVLSSTVSSLTNSTTYYFVVRAYDGNSLTIATSSQVSATPVATSSGGGGGGGGSSDGSTSAPANGVNFTGRAYPGSVVTLLQDAQVAASTVADANAIFSISLAGIPAGNYIYSVYGEDAYANRSSLLSFPVSVASGVTTNIGGIFISPTIDVNYSQIRQGDNLTIFGQSSPKSNITITVHSEATLFLQTASDAVGAYLYNLDTSPLEHGSHSAKSKAALAGQLSEFGAAVSFVVGDESIAKKIVPKCVLGDINCDGRVNLVDFSIMAFWYQKKLVGNGFKSDLNKDGKVTLADFSILASHWTG